MQTNKIGEGLTADVYLDDFRAVKYFKEESGKKIKLTLDKIERMRNIYTRRILLPNNPVFDDNFQLIGYEMEYAKDNSVDSYINLDKEKLKEENELIKKDIKACSDNKLVLNDMIHENASYNNGIYIIDPGDYSFYDKLSNNQVYGINIDYINTFLIFEVIKNYHLLHYNKTGNIKDSYKFSVNINHQYINSKKSDVLEFFSDIEEENLGEFIDKRVNK